MKKTCTECETLKDLKFFRQNRQICNKCESDHDMTRRERKKNKPENDFFNSIVCKPMVRG